MKNNFWTEEKATRFAEFCEFAEEYRFCSRTEKFYEDFVIAEDEEEEFRQNAVYEYGDWHPVETNLLDIVVEDWEYSDELYELNWSWEEEKYMLWISDQSEKYEEEYWENLRAESEERKFRAWINDIVWKYRYTDDLPQGGSDSQWAADFLQYFPYDFIEINQSYDEIVHNFVAEHTDSIGFFEFNDGLDKLVAYREYNEGRLNKIEIYGNFAPREPWHRGNIHDNRSLKIEDLVPIRVAAYRAAGLKYFQEP